MSKHSSSVNKRQILHAEIMDKIISHGVSWRREWQKLAKKLNSYQRKRNPIFCLWYWQYPDAPRKGGSTPHLPIIAFKESKVCSFRPNRKSLYFESSGTTNAGRSSVSRHYFQSLNLYRSSVIRGWEWFLERQKSEGGRKNNLSQNSKFKIQNLNLSRMNFIGLMPSFSEKPHSSLSCMVDLLMKEFGDGEDFWGMSQGQWNWRSLSLHLSQLERESRSSVLFGTAFGWVHFLDWCIQKKKRFNLPKGTMILETGGYKGRSRELKREEFYGEICKVLGVEQNQIYSEYSMCELSSQAYSFPVRVHGRVKFLFRFPPWCRYQVVQPGSSEPVPNGKRGVLEICDLANVDSCAFLRTEDVVVNYPEGFELIGRLPRAGLKGCSLDFEFKINKANGSAD